MAWNIPNWLSLIVAVGALAYITKDTTPMQKLRGKLPI
jgi:hypothetical protein